MSDLRTAARSLHRLGGECGWEAVADALSSFSDADVAALLSCWELWARDEQLRPDGCSSWMFMGGRGCGKTRSGSEDTLTIQEEWGPDYQGLLISKSYQRDIEGVMLFGESGIEACAEARGYKIEYIRSKNLVRYPHGGYSQLISADAAEALRGPQFNHVWADEIAKWNRPLYVWRNIKLANRVKRQGVPVRYTITGTPKRGSPVIHHLVSKERNLQISTGRTRDNIANLDEEAVKDMEADMLGSAFGRQELEGEFIAESGTMTTQDKIDELRTINVPHMRRKIVSFDPAIVGEDDSDDHGIVVCAIDKGTPYPTGYVLADLTLEVGDPEDAAALVVRAALDYEAEIVVEINQGGKWVTSHLRVAMEKLADQLSEERGEPVAISIPILPVWATQAKQVRADPVGGLYGASRVRHAGYFPRLEKELVQWVVGMPSPNRMDALVHGMSHLLLGERSAELTRYA